MKKSSIRKGIAAIVYIEDRDRRKFLLLKRKQNWKGWEWIKGGRRQGENEIKTLKREIKEEIGKKPGDYIAKKTRIIHSFNYQKEYKKDKENYSGAENKIFIVKVFNPKIRIDKKEHFNYAWFDRKNALKKISWPDQKKLFSKISSSLQ